MKDALDPVPALKRQLARAILDQVSPAVQLRTARQLGVDVPRVSNLELGRLERFSLQQLVRFAARVSGEVTIDVAWASRGTWIVPRPRRPRQSQPPPSTFHCASDQVNSSTTATTPL